MNCRDVLVLIPAYLDEEVTPSEKKLIHAHLAHCPNCQQELEVIGGLRNRIRQHLKARAAMVTPSPQAWSLLQASLPSKPPRISVLENAIRSFSIPRWMSIGKLSPQKIVVTVLFIITLFAFAPPVRAWLGELTVLVSCIRTTDANPFVLAETLDIPAFGISIDYPSGWEVEAGYFSASIIQNGGPFHHECYQVFLEFVPLEFYTQPFFQPEDLTLSDLYDNNRRDRGWWLNDPIEVTDVELFGVPAKRVRAEGRRWWEVNFSGVRNDEVFHLSFSAPSEEVLDSFMPTVERILESIRQIRRTGGETIIITAPIDRSAEPFHGSFEVIKGADMLGCKHGLFVDSEFISDRDPSAVLREFTCESGENSGTFTFALLLYVGSPVHFENSGPWSIDETTNEFSGLSGEGVFFVDQNEDDDSGVETLIGKIQYTP